MSNSDSNSDDSNSPRFVHSLYNKWTLFKDMFSVSPEDLARINAINPIDPNETGMDRLYSLWRTFNNGEDALELRIIASTVPMAGLCGFVMGGIFNRRDVYQNFIRQHNHNIFTGKYDANRKLVDYMYIEFFRGGLRQGVRLGIFTGLFVGMLTLSMTYYNDARFAPCALGGGLAAALWKFQLGPRAILVNGVLGSILGLAFAAIIKSVLRISGVSIHELRFYNKSIE